MPALQKQAEKEGVVVSDNKYKYEDSSFVASQPQYGRYGLSPMQIYGGLCIGVTGLIIREIGWQVALGAVAVFVIVGILWCIIRKNQIVNATHAGYINKHNQQTGHCITPGWKYDRAFYKLKCRNCGNAYDVRADRIRSKKCPACQEK